MAWLASFIGIATAVLCFNARFVRSMRELRSASPIALIVFGGVGLIATLFIGWSAWSIAAMSSFILLGACGLYSRRRYKQRKEDDRAQLPAVLSPALAVAPLLLGCAAFLRDPASFFGWAYVVCAVLCAILGAIGSLSKSKALEGVGYGFFIISILLASGEMLYSTPLG